MKKIIIMLILILIATISMAFAYESPKPTCVLIKFENDTRYKNIDSASVLSDLVIEKLLTSGNFNLVETKPIDQDIEAMLYDNKVREIASVEYAMSQGNYTPLFEGPGFNPKLAESTATAQLGQIISPEITSQIGRQHGAEYLIQGTIINLGNGISDNDLQNYGGGEYIRQIEAGIAIQVDLRIIKAATGEVVWQKTVSSLKKKTLTQVMIFKIGSAKLTSETYRRAIEDTAQTISSELIEAVKSGKLFLN